MARVGGGSLTFQGGDFELRAGWGYASAGGVVMGGIGKTVRREYTPDEVAALREGAEVLGLRLEQALDRLGATTLDVSLDEVAYWRNVPAKVWEYRIGGYQVMKKWLSYRERELLGRVLSLDEVREVTNMARRLAALLLLEPALDANYREVTRSVYPWPGADTP